MSEKFACSATRLAGIAARLLGWRPPDFWDATPAELAHSLDTTPATGSPPSRDEIKRMMERDHG